MNRWEVINRIIKKHNYKTYLEIGVRTRCTYDQILLPEENKQSIDPAYDWVTYQMTSDEAFQSMVNNETWDCIFIDGLHTAEQVARDIENSLKHLNDGGTIICHDMLPPNSNHLSLSKCGDGWEAFAKLRTTNENLEMYVVDTDFGCGVIRVGKQTLHQSKTPDNHIDFSYLLENKKELMNVKSITEFKNEFPNQDTEKSWLENWKDVKQNIRS